MYHLEKLRQAGLIRVTKTAKSSKGHEVKYYGPTNLVVVIFPKNSSKNAKRSIFGALAGKYRLVAVGIAGIASAIMSQNIQYEPVHGAAVYATQANPLPVVIPLLVLCLGLLADNMLSRIKR